jgi:hypothetical protein
MGLFGNDIKEITPEQNLVLNNLLPKKLQKETWTPKDFKGEDRIYNRFNSFKQEILEKIGLNESDLFDFKGIKTKEFKEKLFDSLAKKIIIFNTDLFEAKPLGMVDIGMVEKFGTASTGNRFENGVIGYAIEQAFDDTWAKNNAQENSLNKVKLEFLKKAKKAYPDCNMIFKYDVDFREIGTSGNVFIYLRGTAAIGENKAMVETIKENENQEKLRTKQLKEKEKEIEELKTFTHLWRKPQEKYLNTPKK